MKRLLLLVVILLVLAWAGIPAARAVELVYVGGVQPVTSPSDLPVRPITFSATDGVPLRGWMVPAKRSAPTIVLVPGFKAGRMSMLPYARFLAKAGDAVLLYDSRGVGQSGGHFTVGVREVDDVLGAIDYVARKRPGSPIGLLGVSLGAGDTIAAAAQDRRVRATVADSAYVDQEAVVTRLDQLHLTGRVSIPLVPIGPWVVDRLAGVRVASFRPIDVVGRIAPRALFLIHARFDSNPTTPLSAVLALRQAAHPPVELWIAPRGGHAEALAAQPAAYQRRVLRFFRRYL